MIDIAVLIDHITHASKTETRAQQGDAERKNMPAIDDSNSQASVENNISRKESFVILLMDMILGIVFDGTVIV